MDAVLADWETAGIPERTRAALRLLSSLTLHPMELDESFVQALRKDDLDDPAMREAANVSFHFNMMNRLSDAFDFDRLDAKQEALHTKMLNQTGKRLKGKQADPVWLRDVDGHFRPTELARARRPLLNAPGKTTPESSSPGEPPLAKLERQPLLRFQVLRSLLLGSRMTKENPNPSVISYQSLYSNSWISPCI